MAGSYMSREGYLKIKAEIERLKKVKIELSREIGEAAAQGDLSENFGYVAAKEKQAETLRRIDDLEQKLKSAQLIENLSINKDEARIGATVTLKEKESGEEFVYTLVGGEESDPLKGKISVESPLAQGVLGAKVGQDLKVTLPAGIRQFQVVKVEYL